MITPGDLAPKNREEALASISDTDSKRQKVSQVMAILVITVMVLQMIIAVSLKANRASELQTVNQKVDQLKKELTAPATAKLEKTLVALSAGFESLKQKLTTKIDYGRFWSMIQDSQVIDVIYTSLATDDKGNVRIDAKTNSYEKVAKQLQSLKQLQCDKKPCFTKVELTSISKDEDNLKFGVSFIFDQKALIKKD